MDSSFWHRKWSEGQIGFHQTVFNKRLTAFWSDVLAGADPGKVFVPLCGKSSDMLWLHQRGHDVVGIELSEKAVSAFFTENNLSAESDNVDGITSYTGTEQARGIRLMVADYFALRPQHLQECMTFYDRASLIALPEAMRPDYARQLAALMPAGSRGLLLSIAYNEAQMKGPPFSVSDEKVRDLLGQWFTIEQLARFNGPQHVGNLAKRGLESLDERVYLLVRR
ncbi:MAG: thiopurine S-methyltransferase [Granulosicoccus sp.]|nr:thiopurine S-methyltransferase [Granulosicoccus sp.]